MLKVSIFSDGEWIEPDFPASFQLEEVGNGAERLAIALPRAKSGVFRSLAASMSGPFYILYILHTSRGEGEEGRYQSPSVSDAELDDFLERFERFMSSDARHDIWIKSADTPDLIVWSRHNQIFAYGDVARFTGTLTDLGFRSLALPKIGQHQHHYREECDADAQSILKEFNWLWSPLRPEDKQLRS